PDSRILRGRLAPNRKGDAVNGAEARQCCHFGANWGRIDHPEMSRKWRVDAGDRTMVAVENRPIATPASNR
ncbi:MAG TPA: hypothetical protein VEZ59_10795, partial [Sphingopyxis sp.]|nr:hypothetical protein [Sphingopyxis sp.]